MSKFFSLCIPIDAEILLFLRTVLKANIVLPFLRVRDKEYEEKNIRIAKKEKKEGKGNTKK